MLNHYHLLIETPDANLSQVMRQLNGVYAQEFNRRHEKVGHLFQGRFKALIVEKETYLLEVCRYIVLNPVRAGMVRTPGNWRWSSFRSQVGEARAPRFLTTDWILRQFHHADRREARRRFRAFVAERMVADPAVDAMLINKPVLGSSLFADRMQPMIVRAKRAAEIPRASRLSTRPSLQEVFSGCTGRQDTAERIRRAHVDYGYNMKEIARVLGVHYSTVSRFLRTLEMSDCKT
jgi:hypothetical protein